MWQAVSGWGGGIEMVTPGVCWRVAYPFAPMDATGKDWKCGKSDDAEAIESLHASKSIYEQNVISIYRIKKLLPQSMYIIDVLLCQECCSTRKRVNIHVYESMGRFGVKES